MSLETKSPSTEDLPKTISSKPSSKPSFDVSSKPSNPPASLAENAQSLDENSKKKLSTSATKIVHQITGSLNETDGPKETTGSVAINSPANHSAPPSSDNDDENIELDNSRKRAFRDEHDDDFTFESGSFNHSSSKRHAGDDGFKNDRENSVFAQDQEMHPPLPPPVKAATTTYTSQPMSNIGPYQEKDDDGSKSVRMRLLVSTKEAGVVIGTKGSHVSEIKEKMGIFIKVSHQVPDSPDRIVTLHGPLTAVGQSVAYIASKLIEKGKDYDRERRDERERREVKNESTATMRILVPAARMGFIIGKGGSRIKELQSSAGAVVYSSDHNLPNSTERTMTVVGDPEALQIVAYTIGSIIGSDHENNSLPPQVLFDPSFRPSMPMMPYMNGPPRNDRYPSSSGGYPPSSRYPPSSGSGYGGRDGGRDSYSRDSYGGGRDSYSSRDSYRGAPPSSAPGASSVPGYPTATTTTAGAVPGYPTATITAGAVPGYPAAASSQVPQTPAEQQAAMAAYYAQMQMFMQQNPQVVQQYQQYYAQMQQGMMAGRPGAVGAVPAALPVIPDGPKVTDVIKIPQQYVGNIIGRGGANVRDIKLQTGSEINIADQSDENQERATTIVGTAEGNKRAIAMIQDKIAMEKSRPPRNMAVPHRR